ncbi:MAG: lysophospholipid acyltransferase family protein [Steroidobacteraceae bacterium]
MKNLSNAAPAGRERYLRRLAATALCFAVFGAGCLGLSLIAIPAAWLLPGDAAARRLRVRRTIGRALRWFASFTRAAGLLSFEVQGIENLGRPGQLILANHPTLVDAVLLLGLTPSSTCVVKQALWHNPFTRWLVAAAGYVSNSPADRMIEGASEALLAGRSVIIFPEGTRTVPGRPLQFHRGAAAIAVRAATVVTPVYIRCSPSMLTKGDPWYRIPGRPSHFSVRAGPDLDPEPFRRGAPAPIAARELNERLMQVFTEELSPAGPPGRSSMLKE